MELHITEEIRHQLDTGALFVVNHSGGKDSHAMMIKVQELVPRNQLLIIHATLGVMEWNGALEIAKAGATRARAAFVVAKAKRTLVDLVLDRYRDRPEVPSFPSAKNRQCTSDMKRSPITREVRHFAKANGFTKIINCMGMRAQESKARAKKEVYKPNPENGRAGRYWYDWLPIHHFTTQEVYDTIENAGQHPHLAYTLGNERLSCVFCIMASDNDIITGATHNKGVYALYCFLEKFTGYNMHQSNRSLIQITGQQPDYSLLDQYPDIIKKALTIKTTRKHIPILGI